jgi:inositol phosphorylceramide mannosyltransferase catalytic subunit
MRIPKIIHQTVRDKRNLSRVFSENIARVTELNPGWEHRLYDDGDIYALISANYDKEILNAYSSINTRYGAAKADFFRYLLVYKFGGVYLDIKSTLLKKLDEVLLENDEYLLSHWPNGRGMPYEGWGLYRDLPYPGEFQQWHIIATPSHPFLKKVISSVNKNIQNYNQNRDRVGKYAVVRVTGPVAYTQAIIPLLDKAGHRMVNIQDLGFVYSFLDPTNAGFKQNKKLLHENHFPDHYRRLSDPLVIHPRRNSSCP